MALGFAGSLQNSGLVLFPLIITYLFTETKSYVITLLFFIFLMLASTILSLILVFEDSSKSRILYDKHLDESDDILNDIENRLKIPKDEGEKLKDHLK